MDIFHDLPPTLSEEDQEILLNNLPDPRAKEDLITGNLRFVFHIAKKFSNTGVLMEELFSIGTIGLIKAIDSYDIDRNTKLSTFAAMCIQNEILMYLRKEKKHLNKCVSLYQSLNIDDDGNELYIEDVCADSKSSFFFDLYADLDSFFSILNYFSNTLFEKSYRDFIIFFYMLGGNNQKVSANALNLSQSYVSRLFKKFRDRVILLNNSEHFQKNLIHSNYFLFFLKNSELYVGISKMVLDNSALDLFPNKYTNDTYFFVKYPFLQESFIDFAEMFRHLCDLHMIRN